MPSDPIDTYLIRARELLTAGESLPEPDELRDIAVEVAMTEVESEEADRRATELTEGGRRLLDEGRRDEAISLLEDAVLLAPLRLQPHHLLAKALADVWVTYSDDRARTRAVELARRCLALSPSHTPSEELLQSLGLTRMRDTLSWRHAALIVFVLVAVSGSMTVCVRFLIIP
ncbi:MAG: hypothetical protein ACNA8W_15005 [Bradymonadaceae bacterium]